MISKIAPEAVAELRSLRERIKALDPTCDVFLVGGYLRDLIIHGKAKGDFDYVTNLHPDKAANLGFNRVGEAFPVFLTDRGSELACTRTERKTGTGYNGFTTEFTPSFREDALRRDLTVNTALWNPEVGLVFPVEEALEDFNRQELNACTEAFAEDPLRVFRVARFAQRFRWHVGSWTQQLCIRVADEVCQLDTNRVREEFDKVLKLQDGVAVFHSYLPDHVQKHWFGPNYQTRVDNVWNAKGISWASFYNATKKSFNLELSWAWLAMGAEEPVKFLHRFGKGDSTQVVLRILLLIDSISQATEKVDRQTLFQLWISVRRGAVPYEEWKNVIGHLLAPHVLEALEFYDRVPTRSFKNAEERADHYLNSYRQELEDLPPAYGRCNCICHKQPGVLHCFPCCHSGDNHD